LQVKQAEAQKTSADGTVKARLPEAYQWLLVPVQATPQGAVEWQGFRLTGTDGLAVRASKKLRNDELLITAYAGTRLRMELDRVPLWRGDHVAVHQLVEDFARYLYLPRLVEPAVLRRAIENGLALLSWSTETFAYADGYDEATNRYRGLRGGQRFGIADGDAGLLVKPEVARRQMEADATAAGGAGGGAARTVAADPLFGPPGGGGEDGREVAAGEVRAPRRFHGTVTLDTARVGRDAGRVADEVVAHLAGLVGSNVRVTLEIEAEIPSGAPEHVVRVVTENSRTLRFTSQGFEES
jgi:hypothetical protein